MAHRPHAETDSKIILSVCISGKSSSVDGFRGKGRTCTLRKDSFRSDRTLAGKKRTRKSIATFLLIALSLSSRKIIFFRAFPSALSALRLLSPFLRERPGDRVPASEDVSDGENRRLFSQPLPCRSTSAPQLSEQSINVV